MAASKTPTTFDAHLGAVINGLAAAHGGRVWLADLLRTSKKTIDRRMTGDTPLLVKELEIIADAIHSTPEQLVEQALKNYGNGDRDAGFARLRAEDAAEPMSNVGDSYEDEYDITPGGPKEGLALAANKRPKKVNVPPAD